MSLWTIDIDQDGDLDMDDFGAFQFCMNAVFPSAQKECGPANMDGDANVDADDFAAYVNCLSGAGLPIDPACLAP